MTYKLNPAIEKIISPVVLLLPDGTRHTYENGKSVCEAVFEQRYTVKEIRAAENTVELTLEEMTVPMIQSIGEEQVSFF